MLPRENLMETEFSGKVADSEFEGEKKERRGRGGIQNVLAWSYFLVLSLA